MKTGHMGKEIDNILYINLVCLICTSVKLTGCGFHRLVSKTFTWATHYNCFLDMQPGHCIKSVWSLASTDEVLVGCYFECVLLVHAVVTYHIGLYQSSTEEFL